MYPRLFTASRMLVGSLLLSLGLLSGCAGQQSVQSNQAGQSQVTSAPAPKSSNNRMLLPLRNSTPEQLTHSVISFLNGHNTDSIQSVIKDDAFIRITTRAPADISMQLQAPDFIEQLLTAIADQSAADSWYLNRCRVSFDTVYAQCSLLNTDWSWGPLELDIALTVNGYMVTDMTNFNAASSARALASSSIDLYHLLGRVGATSASKVQRMIQAARKGQSDQVVQLYSAMPVNFQKTRFLQVMMLSHVSVDDTIQYLDALEPFALNRYGNDNMVLQVDYHYLQKGRRHKYQALSALDKLDKRMGISDYSRYQRAEVNYALKQYPETLRQSIPLMRNQPLNTQGYWLALLALVSMENHQQAAELITLMISEFGYEFTRANLEGALTEGEAVNIETFLASGALRTVLL